MQKIFSVKEIKQKNCYKRKNLHWCEYMATTGWVYTKLQINRTVPDFHWQICQACYWMQLYCQVDEKIVNRKKTLLDKLTTSDIAYRRLGWGNQYQVTSKTEDEVRKNATYSAKPKFHEGLGKSSKWYEDGWAQEGVTYYKELCVIIQALKKIVPWNILHVHWHAYNKKKHHETYFVTKYSSAPY